MPSYKVDLIIQTDKYQGEETCSPCCMFYKCSGECTLFNEEILEFKRCDKCIETIKEQF